MTVQHDTILVKFNTDTELDFSSNRDGIYLLPGADNLKITSINTGGGQAQDGRELFIRNVSRTRTVTIENNSASSSDWQYKIELTGGDDFDLAPGDILWMNRSEIIDVSGALTVTGATSASPIAVTTSTAHGLMTGDSVFIEDVGGNTAANGLWEAITVTGANTFTIDGSSGGGAYTSGGTVKWIQVGWFCDTRGQGTGLIGTDILSADATTTSGSFADLTTKTFSLGEPGDVLVMADFGISALLALTATLQLQVDGVAKETNDVVLALGGGSRVNFLWAGTLAAGSHTIRVQWKTTGSTLRCRASSVPSTEHGVMVINRVS